MLILFEKFVMVFDEHRPIFIFTIHNTYGSILFQLFYIVNLVDNISALRIIIRRLNLIKN